MVDISERDFYRLTDYVRKNYGLELSQKKTLIEYRLSAMLEEKKIENFSEYFEHVIKEPSKIEITEIINRLTTNHSFFMREADHYSFLQNTVLKQFEESLPERDLRVWSAGCATGEEPYTLAMLLKTYFKDSALLWDTKILATDISVKALNHAERGRYESNEIKLLPPLWQMNYFLPTEDKKYEISKQLKNEIIFRIFNLIDPVFPFKKKFHIIFCRNVMIYFDAQTRADLIEKFYQITEPGGYLFIGHSETIDRSKSEYRFLQPSVYQKGGSNE
jgi:Methylase of chemotaxis methyl-accepting proteins